MKYTDRYNAEGLAMLKEYEAKHGIYHVGDWRFFITENGEFQATYDRDKYDMFDEIGNVKEDFSAVIAEAKKHGYNVDAVFLNDQVMFLDRGFKLNRFLPDRSGQVFSPIVDNGIIFRFAPITADSREYVC